MQSVIEADLRMTGRVRSCKMNNAVEGGQDEPVHVYIGDTDIQRVDWMGGITEIQILFIS